MYKATNIKWETDGYDVKLPTEMRIPVELIDEDDVDEDAVSDWLSDKTGYIKALQEMGNMQLEYSPFYVFPNEDSRLDPDGVKDFFRYKKMDVYGKDWKNKETGGAIWK